MRLYKNFSVSFLPLLLLCFFPLQAQEILSTVYIDDGWFIQDEANKIIRVNSSAQIEASFSLPTIENYSGIHLLYSNTAGSQLAFLMWSKEGEEAITLWDPQLPKRYHLIELEDKSLRSIRMSDNGQFLAVLLSDGLLYKVEIHKDKPLLKQFGSIPSLSVSEWLINNEGKLKWVEPSGVAFERNLSLDGKSVVKKLFESSERIKATFYDPNLDEWLLQDVQGTLFLVDQDEQMIQVGQSAHRILQWLDGSWVIEHPTQDQLLLKHLLLPLSYNLSQDFSNLLIVSKTEILGIGHNGELRALSIQSLYKDFSRSLSIQKRVRIEESTNGLSSLYLDRSRMTTQEFMRQKSAIRAAFTEYIDRSLSAWEMKRAYAVSGFNWTFIDQEQLSEAVEIEHIRWETDQLTPYAKAGDRILLHLNLDREIQLIEQLNSLSVRLENESKALPLEWLNSDKSTSTVRVNTQLPKQFSDDKEWVLVVNHKQQDFRIAIPNGRRNPLEVLNADLTPTVNSEKLERLRIDGKINEATKHSISISVFLDNRKIENKTHFESQEDGSFSQVVELKKSSLPTEIKVDLQIEGEPTQTLVFEMDSSYPFQIRQKSAQNIVSGEIHPLLKELPTSPIVEADHTYALLIGNQSYKYAPSADYAIRDMRFMHTYLTEVMGVPKEHIFHAENASLSDFRFYLGEGETEGRLMDIANRKDKRLIVYYSGHGLPSLDGKDGYLLPSDARLNRPDISSLALSTFYDQLLKLEMGEVLVFLESCFSGRTANGENLFPSSSGSIGVRLKIPLLAQDHVAIFTASGSTELSSWDHELHTGLFTARLVRGINHFAKTKPNARVEDLQQWLLDGEKGVPAEAKIRYSREQTPQLITNDFNLPLFYSNKGRD